MNQTIKLDTRKREGKYGEARIAPLRRGERNNAMLTVKVCANGQPYDLAGKTASLVATTEAGKLVGPCPMQVAEAGIARIMLPAALYSAVGAFSGYIEIREGETLVDTTDSFGGKVIECADLDSEQAAEFTPLLGELQNAVAAEAKRAEAEKARARAEAERETGFAEAKQAVQTATEAANDAAEGANLAASSASTAAGKAESDVRAFVNAAGTEIGDAIAAAREDVDAAVKRSDAATAKAEDATETANAANTAATQAVSVARKAIAEVKATEAKLYPAAENIIVRSETGTVAHVEDAFAGATLRKITVEGACKQDGIPSPESPKPISVVEHPTVKVMGKNLLDIHEGMPLSDCSKSFYSSEKRIIKPGTYVAGLTFNNYLASNSVSGLKIADGSISFDTIDSSYGVGVGVDLASGATYIDSATDYHSFYDKDGTYLRYVFGRQFQVPDDAAYSVAIFRLEASDSHFSESDIAITHVADNGEYAPYTSQTLTFTLPSEHPYLAKLPDGTADTIEVDKDGNVGLIARVEKREVTDNASWFIQDAGIDYSLAYEGTDLVGLKKNLSASELINNKFMCKRSWENNPCFGISEVIWVVPRKNSKDITVAEVKKATKDVVFYAPLAKPKTYALGKINLPALPDPVSNVWTDAEVTPNTSIEYVRDVNIVVANLEAAIASITEG